MDGYRDSGDPGGLGQESAFAAVAFDQLDALRPHDGQNQAGKSGAAAEIDETPAMRRQMWEKLRQSR